MTKTMQITRGSHTMDIKVTLVTERAFVLDGDTHVREVADIVTSIDYDGKAVSCASVRNLNKPMVSGTTTYHGFVELDGRAGKRSLFGLTADDMTTYDAMVAAVEAAPEYAAKISAEKATDDFFDQQTRLYQNAE